MRDDDRRRVRIGDADEARGALAAYIASHTLGLRVSLLELRLTGDAGAILL